MATEIITGLNPGIRPSISNFRDWAFMVDGDNIPRYFDQNGAYEWMHKDPTTAITTDESQSGSITGTVKYFYTEYNITSGDGDLHSGHESNPGPTKTTASLTSKKVVLTLPSTLLNTGFTHLKIYATDPNGEVFYFRICGDDELTINNISFQQRFIEN